MRKASYTSGIALTALVVIATRAYAYIAADLDPTYQFAGSTVATSINDLGAATVLVSGTESDSYYVQNNSWSLVGDQNDGTGVNNSGQVAGVQYDMPSNVPHAEVWSNGAIQLMQDDGFGSVAYGISNGGVVAGAVYSSASTDPSGGTFHAAVWQDGQADLLSDYGGDSSAVGINNIGQEVGYAVSDDGLEHAVVWTNGVIQDLGTFSGNSVNAVAINDLGQVVGTCSLAGGDQHAFFWSNDVFQDLQTLGGTSSYALGINDMGQVVGQSQVSPVDNTTVAGFVWSSGAGMQALCTLGGQSCSATSINNSGYVAGWSNDASGNTRAVVWDPVPEPSGLLSLVFGIVALAGLRLPKNTGV